MRASLVNSCSVNRAYLRGREGRRSRRLRTNSGIKLREPQHVRFRDCKTQVGRTNPKFRCRIRPGADGRALSFHPVGGGLVAAHAGVSAGRDVIPSSRHSDVLGVVVLGVPRQGARRARLSLMQALICGACWRKASAASYVARGVRLVGCSAAFWTD